MYADWLLCRPSPDSIAAVAAVAAAVDLNRRATLHDRGPLDERALEALLVHRLLLRREPGVLLEHEVVGEQLVKKAQVELRQ